MVQKQVILSLFGFFILSIASLFCGVTKVDGVKRLDNEQFKKLMDKEGYVVLDVRTPAEYDSVRIEGSILMNVSDTSAFNNKMSELDPDKNYLIYCRSGRRSMTAAKILKQKGFKHVSDLQNGISGWDGPTISGKKE